jgi:hypothetical protein
MDSALPIKLWVLLNHGNNLPISNEIRLVLAIGANINLTGLLADQKPTQNYCRKGGLTVFFGQAYDNQSRPVFVEAICKNLSFPILKRDQLLSLLGQVDFFFCKLNYILFVFQERKASIPINL